MIITISCLFRKGDETWAWLDPGIMAVIGAAGLLGGVTRLNLAITVIIVCLLQLKPQVQFHVIGHLMSINATSSTPPFLEYMFEYNP